MQQKNVSETVSMLIIGSLILSCDSNIEQMYRIGKNLAYEAPVNYVEMTMKQMVMNVFSLS